MLVTLESSEKDPWAHSQLIIKALKYGIDFNSIVHYLSRLIGPTKGDVKVDQKF